MLKPKEAKILIRLNDQVVNTEVNRFRLKEARKPLRPNK